MMTPCVEIGAMALYRIQKSKMAIRVYRERTKQWMAATVVEINAYINCSALHTQTISLSAWTAGAFSHLFILTLRVLSWVMESSSHIGIQKLACPCFSYAWYM